MRRLLAILVAALPAAAAAQTEGQLLVESKSDYVINQEACEGSGEVGLTWWASEETDGDFADYTGQYDVYAGPTDKTDAFPYCIVDEQYRLTGETITDPASLKVTTPVKVSVNELVTKAGYGDCTADTKTVYVCVVWKNEAGAVKAYAKGDVELKTAAPAAPTVASVSPGEEALYVRIEAAATGTVAAAEFRAKAWDAAGIDPNSYYSDWESDGTVRIGGLTNGVAYTLVAQARSEDGNVSPYSSQFAPSAATTPVPVLDGWEAYEEYGQDSGGCQAGGAGPLALAVAAALLRLRRRRAELPSGSGRRP
jgi:MYXO-CTERM domain-containing protein